MGMNGIASGMFKLDKFALHTRFELKNCSYRTGHSTKQDKTNHDRYNSLLHKWHADISTV